MITEDRANRQNGLDPRLEIIKHRLRLDQHVGTHCHMLICAR
jgi:hypothetical protein